MKRAPRRVLLALLLAPLALGYGAATHAQTVLHREKSLYRDILVTESTGIRCLTFSVRNRAGNRQSCIDPQAPDRLVLDYTRLMLVGLYAQPAPRRVLVVGLGGGVLPRTLAKLLPDATIDTAEIDEAVLRVAQRWFLYAPSARVTTAVQDGRVYVKRALKAGTKYDLVFLDAYDHEYIPEHMLTREFLAEVRGLLTPGGVVVANTFSSSRLYDSESVTYEAVYGPFLEFKASNRIIVAGLAPPQAAALRAAAPRWDAAFAPLGVSAEWLWSQYRAQPQWDRSARILTDQYSPSNLLNSR